ncbi:hypothetical protein [Hymenobacter rigui]|uniref:Uncharacterized protein n=1 Tax=Hymenobacter rigui TaxID=334424 RepID=A0A428KTZ5_9BACT|nr:hypothetical protein [Hymenobacter rigui]RSK50099.1 hypothetical protein EI291_05460 [Hymenobacter rigui]
MATPINFPEANAVLQKPANMTDEECCSLPILRTDDGQCISQWQLGPEELISINQTHCVTIGLLSGHTQPPMWVQGSAPALEQTNKSNLVLHARAELKAAGLWDETADYGGEVANSVMQLVQVLSYQGHSGGSHDQTLNLFEKLARFQPLGPLTNNPEEWMDVSYGGEPIWQSRRQSDAFSKDGGKTFYTLDGPEGREFIHTATDFKAAA